MKTNHEKPVNTIFRLSALCCIFALQKNKQVGEGNTFIQTGDRDPRADTSKNSQVVSAA